MPLTVYIPIVATIWFACGLSAALFLGRHGHRSWAWYVIGLVLGPIMLPIATEVAHRRGILVLATTPSEDRGRLRALAAIDGSVESDLAFKAALGLLEPTGASYILLTVIDADLADDADERRRAEEVLRDRASWVNGGGTRPLLEIATGEPGREVLDRSVADDVDVVVLGRRGHGMSEHLFGSVAGHVVRHCPRAVLVGPAPAEVRDLAG